MESALQELSNARAVYICRMWIVYSRTSSCSCVHQLVQGNRRNRDSTARGHLSYSFFVTSR